MSGLGNDPRESSAMPPLMVELLVHIVLLPIVFTVLIIAGFQFGWMAWQTLLAILIFMGVLLKAVLTIRKHLP